MSKKQKARPFNLLYKFEPQKDNIDKVYDWVMGTGRIIVISIMIVVIASFVYRFPLDRKLNDQVNLANDNMKKLEANASEERNFRTLIAKIKSAKLFTEIYPANLGIKSDIIGQVRFSQTLKKVMEINSQYAESVKITNYSYVSDPQKGTTLLLTGSTTSPDTIEEFRQRLRNENTYFTETLLDVGSNKETGYRFTINAKIREEVK